MGVRQTARAFNTSAGGLCWTALTDGVKTAITAHAGPAVQPTAGRRHALRMESTTTIHVTAANLATAREVLEGFAYEDFDVALRT